MNTEQTIQRLIDQDIYTNASVMVAGLNDMEIWDRLPATYEALLDAMIKDDWEEPVRDALQDITPAGFLDVCDVIGANAYTKDGTEIDPDNVETVEHNDVDRQALIGALEESGDWQEVADHLDLEPHTHEALQHWLVSDYLADALEEVGALVARDVLGFNVWGRTECGQSLTRDSDLHKVAELIEARLASMRD